MLNPGRVLTRAQILDHVWDYDFGGSSTVVSTYVAYVRRKLASYGPDVIHTQRAVGYSLRLPDLEGPGGPPMTLSSLKPGPADPGRGCAGPSCGPGSWPACWPSCCRAGRLRRRRGDRPAPVPAQPDRHAAPERAQAVPAVHRERDRGRRPSGCPGNRSPPRRPDRCGCEGAAAGGQPGSGQGQEGARRRRGAGRAEHHARRAALHRGAGPGSVLYRVHHPRRAGQGQLVRGNPDLRRACPATCAA